VRTGVDTTLVAPVSVGDDAYTGAGSVIVEDVPAGALGIARARQTNVEGYARRASDVEEGATSAAETPGAPDGAGTRHS
jgi:bifunctional UDP-N-acetylglucosamine pyrophosphorylase/glucosamine-1-phosphate N-acetyltransferase